MNRSKSRAMTVCTVFLGLAVVILAAAVLAQHFMISQVSRQVAGQKLLLDGQRRELQERTTSSKDYAELSRKLGGTIKTCVWSDQAPFMMGQLSGIVEPVGLKVQTLQPQPMTVSKSILRFPMRIGLKCGLRPLTEVLAGLKSTTPLMSVERLDIRRQKDAGDTLQADMTLASFVVLDPLATVTERRLIADKQKAEGGPGTTAYGSQPEPRFNRKPPEPTKPRPELTKAKTRPDKVRPESESKAESLGDQNVKAKEDVATSKPGPEAVSPQPAPKGGRQ